MSHELLQKYRWNTLEAYNAMSDLSEKISKSSRIQNNWKVLRVVLGDKGVQSEILILGSEIFENGVE